MKMMASITLKAEIIKIVTIKAVKIKAETMMVYQEHVSVQCHHNCYIMRLLTGNLFYVYLFLIKMRTYHC